MQSNPYTVYFFLIFIEKSVVVTEDTKDYQNFCRKITLFTNLRGRPNANLRIERRNWVHSKPSVKVLGAFIISGIESGVQT